MASTMFSLSVCISIFLALLFQINATHASSCFKRIFSFGDSIIDTGNYWIMSGRGNKGIFAPPYGETYFHHPVGRWSDGRVIVDFIAPEFGLDFLEPSASGNNSAYSQNGANFAVAMAQAMNITFYNQITNNNISWPDHSLNSYQIPAFKTLLPIIAQGAGSDIPTFMNSSLFIVGEIGGNDYNFALFALKPIEQVRAWAPYVIAEIGIAINELINLGATTLVVPGNFPIGCAPCYLTAYQTNNASDYDPETGCITWLNEFSVFHNNLLQEELNKQRQLHPNAKIIYADYYGAQLDLYKNAKSFGLPKPLNACCGGPGPYNFSYNIGCGANGSSLCPDPSKYISWDGAHQTEFSYQSIANGILNGPYADPPLTKLC